MISGVKSVKPLIENKTKRLLYKIELGELAISGYYLYSDGKISPKLVMEFRDGYRLSSIKGDWLNRTVYEISEYWNGRTMRYHLLHDHEFVFSSQAQIWCNIIDRDLFIRRQDEEKKYGAWRLEKNFERFSGWYDVVGAPYKTPTGKTIFIAKGMKDSVAIVDFVEQGWYPIVMPTATGYKFGKDINKLTEVLV